jgi:hypothetical protein
MKGEKMLRKIVSVFVFIMAMVAISIAHGQQQTLRITVPRDNANVPERLYVEGTAKDSNLKVWVIVHPMEVSDYWVQPAVTVKENGSWKVKIYIGRPGSVDADKHFEIMAVANTKNKVKEGDVLSYWPEALAKSQVVEVIRK